MMNIALLTVKKGNLMNHVFLEICCGSAQDGIAAWNGGAKRVELNSDLFHGGLTPSLGELIVLKQSIPDLKVMCMVRPREGGFCYTDLEFKVMLTDARLLLEHGADGIVFGFLHPNGTIDKNRCKKMLEVIGKKESVFHRAIDVVPDVMTALDELISLGVTRVLTSGQKPTAFEGAETIQAMVEHAAGRIEILPGSGIRPHNAAECRDIFKTPYLHASMHRIVHDYSLTANPSIHFHGNMPLPEDQYKMIDAEDINNFIKKANEY